MSKLIKFLMAVWLLIAATGLITGIYFLFTKGIKDALYFFILCVVAIIMYFINKRRFKLYVKQ